MSFSITSFSFDERLMNSLQRLPDSELVVSSTYADVDLMACQRVGTLLWGVVQIQVMIICSVAAYNDTGRAR